MIYFPYQRLGTLACKYGVIETAALRRDLREWDTLYCSGRLHKPVRLVQEPAAETGLAEAMEHNRSCAVSAAMALLSASGTPVASEEEMFMQIAWLSYEGDVRMGVGEDPAKVSNIVRNNLDAFSALYRAHLKPLLRDGSLTYGKSVAPAVGEAAMARLPPRYRQLHPSQLRQALAKTVRRSSTAQTAMNVLSAGFGKSVSYAWRKLGKRFL
jgi:translocator assembly and maintenance protein 41